MGRFIFFLFTLSCLSRLSGQNPFVTEWKVSVGVTIDIPVNPAFNTYKYDVDWNGDGIYDDFSIGGDASHTYIAGEVPESGLQKISIRGTYPAIYLNEGTSAPELRKIIQWGDIEWKSMERAFRGASNMTYTATDKPDLSSVTSMSEMFSGASKFDANINDWDVSKVENMNALFFEASEYNSPLNSWDLSSATEMSFMFSRATKFNQPLNAWDVSSVIRMQDVFSEASSFNQPLHKWEPVKVVITASMFRDAIAFNQPLNKWNTTSFSNLDRMFQGATSFNQPLDEWITTSFSNLRGMFDGASSFDQSLGDWKLSGISWPNALERLLDGTALSIANYDHTLTSWSQQQSIPIGETVGAAGLLYCAGEAARNALSSAPNNWNFVDDIKGCPTDAFITTWQTTEAGEEITIKTNANYTYNFAIDWDDDGIVDTTSLTSDITHSYLTAGKHKVAIFGTFPHFRSNATTSVPDLQLVDINQWGSAQWESFENSFFGCSNLKYSASDMPDLSQVSDMSYAFSNCSQFNGDITDWDVSNVTNMSSLFKNAILFNQDLSNWDVFNVEAMNSMFYQATAFDQSLGDWEIRLVEEMDDMLSECGMSEANYDTTLIGWEDFGSGQGTLIQGVNFGASGLHYCGSIEARKVLITDFDWDIIGDSPNCPFITTWRTTQTEETITIFTNPDYTYNFDIDWENDGIIDATGVTGEIAHEYPAAGDYQVAIFGDFPHFRSKVAQGGSNNTQLVDINQWGSIEWESMRKSFNGSVNLEYSAEDAPDLSRVQNFDFIFANCFAFNGDIGHWDVSNVTSMWAAFSRARVFNQNLDEWDVSKVKNMFYMFRDTEMFNSPLNGWIVDSVVNMSHMFDGASAFNQPLDMWTTTHVTNMSHMFASAVAFNKPLNGWTVDSVMDMSHMFYRARTFDQPLDLWTTSRVTDMSSMFLEAESFNSSLNGWDVDSVINMSRMFSQATSFDQSLDQWITTSVKDMSSMFSRASSFDQNLNGWNVDSVLNMRRIFENATVFNHPLNEWVVSSVTDMSFMFSEATTFNQDLNEWEVDSVVNMSGMFSRATSFNKPLHEWIVSSVTNMAYMFSGASSFDQPLNEWDVSSTTSMIGMFANVDGEIEEVPILLSTPSTFNQPLDLWDVSQVTDMRYMFYASDSFNQDLSSWNIASVENMTGMLSDCNISVDNYDATLVGWSIKNVQDNVTLGAQDLEYCDASIARQSLIDDHNWSILGDFECGSVPPCDEIVVNTNYTLSDNSWNVVDGWSLMRVPDYCDDVIIEGDKSILKTVTLTDHGLAASLEVQEGAAFIVDGFTLTILRPEVIQGDDKD